MLPIIMAIIIRQIDEIFKYQGRKSQGQAPFRQTARILGRIELEFHTILYGIAA